MFVWDCKINEKRFTQRHEEFCINDLFQLNYAIEKVKCLWLVFLLNHRHFL